MQVGEQWDSRSLPFCKVLGMEYGVNVLTLRCLSFGKPNLQSAANSSCSLSFPIEPQSLPTWLRWPSVKSAYFREWEGRKEAHYNSAFKTHLLGTMK